MRPWSPSLNISQPKIPTISARTTGNMIRRLQAASVREHGFAQLIERIQHVQDGLVVVDFEWGGDHLFQIKGASIHFGAFQSVSRFSGLEINPEP